METEQRKSLVTEDSKSSHGCSEDENDDNDDDDPAFVMSPSRREIVSWPPNSTLGTPKRRPRNTTSQDGKVFKVWPMSHDSRICNDEAHGDIIIPPAVHAVLDTPPVQRLGSLKQLGCAVYTYPCCTHTRKEHSLGVMELAGKQATVIQVNQPKLGVSDLDILCVRIAGLCHDLGHGPFSHAYEAFIKAVYKNERDHSELYQERNHLFREQFGIDIPPLPEFYEHEKTSLMMIDSLLAHLGLQIDWDNLDKPLKQVGNGLDAKTFGLVSQIDNNEITPFSSRDWIFIKECVYGMPLEYPDSPKNQSTFIGRDENKVFLYDIVNNRHSGCDTDKMDYFDRDSSSARKKQGSNYTILIREARIAWAICPNPKTCFECKHKEKAKHHLMFCYPSKLVETAMNFFYERMKNHQEIYTHKKTKSAELHLIDLLLEADKEFCMLLLTQLDDPDGFPVHPRHSDFRFHKLPISRAWMYPRLFLRLDDGVVGIIEHIAIESHLKLPKIRKLLEQRRSHAFYKLVGEVEIGTTENELWSKSEDDIKKDMMREEVSYAGENGGLIFLNDEDIICEKRELHFGRKEHNPVSQMRFWLNKWDKEGLKNSAEQLPVAKEIDDASLPANTPKSFIRRTIRFYSRTSDKNEFISHAFCNWLSHRKECLDAPNGFSLKTFIDDDCEEQYSQPRFLTQESEVFSPEVKRAKRCLDYP